MRGESMTANDDRTRIDKWLWAGAPDSVTAERAGAGRGAAGRRARTKA